MPNFETIGQTIGETWLFSFFKMAAICHIIFLNVHNFNFWYGSEDQFALLKFHINQTNHCRDMAIFRFSRWRPSTILDLVHAYLGLPTKSSWYVYHCANLVEINFQCYASLAWKCLLTPRRPVITRGDNFWGRVALKLVAMTLVFVKLVIKLWRFAPPEKIIARSDWYMPWVSTQKHATF